MLGKEPAQEGLHGLAVVVEVSAVLGVWKLHWASEVRALSLWDGALPEEGGLLF